jgi:hypothetical protein
MPVFFPFDDVEIYDVVTDGDRCGLDSYRKPKTCETLIATVKGDFQEKSPERENIAIPGTMIQATYVLILPTGTEINSTSKVKVNGNMYRVVGQPIYNNLIPNIEVNLTELG